MYLQITLLHVSDQHHLIKHAGFAKLFLILCGGTAFYIYSCHDTMVGRHFVLFATLISTYYGFVFKA